MTIAKMLYQNENVNTETLHFGITVGVVTDINDPEKLGRIKVKLLLRDTSAFETDFIRVMSPMVGQEWGMFFLPEVGDEVLIGFANGDLARPYVLGSLYNSNQKPPITIQDGKNDTRIIKTKNGNVFSFSDVKDKEKIEIYTPKQIKAILDDEQEQILLQDKDGKNMVKVDMKNGMVTVAAEKKITLQTGKSFFEIDGNSDQITIDAGQSMQLKSQQISIQAKGGIQMQASSNINIKADGPLNCKGAVIKLN